MYVSSQHWLSMSAALALAIACAPTDSQESSESSESGSSSTGDQPFEIEVAWETCPAGFVSECASVEVPLDWDAPQGETISVLVARRPAPQSPASGQLWLVMGGPGDSAEVFAGQGLVDALAFLAPTLDVYVMEHRGVGDSTWLGCEGLAPPPGTLNPDLDAMQSCIDSLAQQYGDGLRHMSSRGAAHDMHAIIEHTREGAVVLYGVSYGTLLVQRHLQLFPDDVDAVVLDSLYAPGAQFMEDYDAQWDRVARALADRCERDELCASKLGPDAWSRVAGIVESIEAGHCPEVARPAVELPFLWFSMIDSAVLREHLLPLLYRIERCSPADVEVLDHYFGAVEPAIATTSSRTSDVLRMHIAYNEEWGPDAPTVDEVVERCDDAVFCPEISADIARFSTFWPQYDEPLAHRWPTFEVPVLVMQGDLDAKTPVWTARTVIDRLSGPHQQYVEFPDVTHAVIANSFTDDGGLIPCGVQLLAAFAQQPDAALDPACVETVVRLDFVGTSDQNVEFFGVADRWENE